MSGPRYAFIPGAAVDDPELTPTAFRLLAFLGRHTNDNGWCRIKQKTIAAEMSLSRSTVQLALNLLYARGWVEKRHEGWSGVDPDPKGRPFAAHSYRVCIAREAPFERIEAEPVPIEDGRSRAERALPLPDGEVPCISGTGGALPGSGTRCPTSSGTYKRSTSNEQKESPPVGPPRGCGQNGVGWQRAARAAKPREGVGKGRTAKDRGSGG